MDLGGRRWISNPECLSSFQNAFYFSRAPCSLAVGALYLGFLSTLYEIDYYLKDTNEKVYLKSNCASSDRSVFSRNGLPDICIHVNMSI